MRGHASEVHERVVVPDVVPAITARVAAPWQGLEESLPPEPAGGELTCQGGVSVPTLAAVARAPLRRAGDHRQIVREARMPGRVEVARDAVAARHAVQERRAPVPEDLTQTVVLHHEHPHVMEPRHARLGGRCADREGRTEAGEDAPGGTETQTHGAKSRTAT